MLFYMYIIHVHIDTCMHIYLSSSEIFCLISFSIILKFSKHENMTFWKNSERCKETKGTILIPPRSFISSSRFVARLVLNKSTRI